jgi:predicted O-linked N-acetylglucosamine transferase (SPINDLY family)
MLSNSLNVLKQQAKEAFNQKKYLEAALFCEQLVEHDPETINYIWWLGLARLLAGDEAEAQFTWMMALSNAEPDQIEVWTADLVQLLDTEAKRQEASEDWQLAWAIRQHLREVAPAEIHNLLHLVRLAVRLDLSDAQCLLDWEVILLLQSKLPDLDERLLLNTMEAALEVWFDDLRVKDFAETALRQFRNLPSVLTALMAKAVILRSSGAPRQTELAVYLAEICLQYDPNNLEALRLLAIFYEVTQQYSASVEAAQRFRAACQTLDEKMVGNAFLMGRLLRTGQYWQETADLLAQQEALAQELIAQYTPHLEHSLLISILTSCYSRAYYLDDSPAQHRPLQNQLAALLQSDLRFHAGKAIEPYQKRFSSPSIKSNRKLRIGYIGHTMRQHSVGWLARWLMQYHDREQFDIYTYHVHIKKQNDPFTQRWFVEPVTESRAFGQSTCVEIAKQIGEDEIDILVELDSITYDHTCGVLTLRPAPIQVSWLGFDATGIPAVDYFLADPYVLPELAQSYYSEKIWRLPSTYLAVDGFEIGIPTLRRDQLGISPDAVVYLSAQSASKRHPVTARLQVQILREVPNSYLLIKGFSEEASLKQAFRQLAEAEGVDSERLHFLNLDADEPTHRANLGIADVVLDTYPYNGATTTLETLWMGIPIVTRTGQQWAARNSYAMLKNVGIDEGIAWTDEEYVEWGIRLGNDVGLRQQIRMRLLQSRQTSPLWNTKLFAGEMENAYQQMWQKYIEKQTGDIDNGQRN